MAQILRAYNVALVRRPYATNCLTAATLFGAGDVIAQQAIEGRGLAQHDFARTARLAIYGGAIFGPLATTWYNVLNRLKMQSPVAKVASSVALDQFAFTPVALSVFFTGTTLLEGKSFADAQNKIQSVYWDTLQKNWQLWIPIQALNFAIVPPHLRLVVVNATALVWNTYLSYASANSAKS